MCPVYPERRKEAGGLSYHYTINRRLGTVTTAAHAWENRDENGKYTKEFYSYNTPKSTKVKSPSRCLMLYETGSLWGDNMYEKYSRLAGNEGLRLVLRHSKNLSGPVVYVDGHAAIVTSSYVALDNAGAGTGSVRCYARQLFGVDAPWAPWTGTAGTTWPNH